MDRGRDLYADAQLTGILDFFYFIPIDFPWHASLYIDLHFMFCQLLRLLVTFQQFVGLFPYKFRHVHTLISHFPTKNHASNLHSRCADGDDGKQPRCCDTEFWALIDKCINVLF